MVDISMCPGEGCEVKDTCYRYTAKPSQRQSYFETPGKDESCEYYWPVRAEDSDEESV